METKLGDSQVAIDEVCIIYYTARNIKVAAGLLRACCFRACSYGQKFSRLARKHFDKFTSEISPSYENSMKSYLAFI